MTREEQRKSPRTQRYVAESLRIETADSYTPPVFRESSWQPQLVELAGGFQLVDVSDEGLGLLTRVFPFPVGSVVSVAGDFHSVETCFQLQARLQVAHALAQEDGTFRVGLAFLEQVSRQQLGCIHEPEFILSLDAD